MGNLDDLAKNPNIKKRGRGSVNNMNRLETFNQAQSGAGADWGGCAAEKIQAVVVGITELGGAVTFGLSRDNGAHSLTLMLDGSRATLWFNGNADLDDELIKILGTLGGLT